MAKLKRPSNSDSDLSAFAAAQTSAPGKRPRTGTLDMAPRNGAGGDSDTATATDARSRITNKDIQFEIIAHHVAYRDTISDEAAALLEQWGYQGKFAAKINDAATGFFVGLIMPQPDRTDLTPILTFRGTEGASDFGDLVSDINPVAVGFNQFKVNRRFVGQLIAEAGGRVDVTGHSLGGALAQHAAAAFPGAINQIITFQSPGIHLGAADSFNDNPNRTQQITHHIAAGDVVDNAGDAHLEGEFFRHDVGGGPASHVRYLFSTPEFAEQRAQLGITDEVMAGLGIDKQKSKGPVEHSEKNPEPIMGTVSEGVRRGVAGPLYPILNGVNVLLRKDDAALRAFVTATSEAELAGMPVSERSYMIDRFCRGLTGRGDKNAILKVLEASVSAGDVVAVLDLVDPYLIANNLVNFFGDGAYPRVRPIYRSHYYAQTSQDNALKLIMNCINGYTSEWEEEIIADILTSRGDGRALITQIGGIYGSGGFDEGLSEIKWNIDGSEQRRVEAMFAR
ncbi:MAG: hypothetical protein AAGC55_16355 [Myxococcota bacterium]